MTGTEKKRLLFVGVLVVLSLVVLAPNFFAKLPESWPANPVKLGLDLRGGSYLVLGVQTEEAVKSRLASIASAIRAESRKKKFGVVRARQVGQNEIELTLLNDSKLDALESFIQREYSNLRSSGPAKTSGRRVVLRYNISDISAKEIEKNAVEQAIETVNNRVNQYGVAEPVIQRTGEKRLTVQLPDVTDLDRVKRTIGSVAKLEFRLTCDQDLNRQRAIGSRVSCESMDVREGGTQLIEEDVLMTGDAIDTAQATVDPTSNEVEVILSLTNTGRRTFANITSENVGRQLAIILDGIVQSAPVIRERIGGGRASITGGFTLEDATLLSIILRAGALPAPLTFLEERTVGATLGADSINKGINALLIGAGLVILFTFVYFKTAGGLAVVSLTLNLVFLMTLLALLNATLTLPGLAGIVLTVGMAIDGNVIIFERIKEELRNGATARGAIEAGFKKAHWTILDANITTLLTGLVLYGFGTGPIKGFAVTLCFGIVSSVFCVLFVSRLGFDLLRLKPGTKELSI